MIVVDASTVVELLLNSARGRQVAARIASPVVTLHAPHLLDLEACQALRRYASTGVLDAGRAAQAVEHLRQLDLDRYPHEPLLPRIWALRENLAAYDAAYVALAEAIEATLLTCDSRLAKATEGLVDVELLDP